MAGGTPGRRKPAAKASAKEPEAKAVKGAKAEGAATGRRGEKPAAAAKLKPAGTKSAKPAAARSKPAQSEATQPESAEARLPDGPSGMVLALDGQVRMLPGCGFGIRQPLMLGTIDVKLPDGFDLRAIEPYLEEFALAPPDEAAEADGADAETHLVQRVLAWQAAIQRGGNVPVFGGCRLWDKGAGRDGSRKIGFAAACYARPAVAAALQFVIDTVHALAPTGAEAETALPALRKRFGALQQVLGRHALLGINSIHFIEAAHTLGIEFSPWSDLMWVYGLGRNRLVLNSSVTSHTPQIAVGVAKDKFRCSAVLRAAGLPVAASGLAANADGAAKLAQQIGYPVVVKPADMDQGAGVTAGIEDEADLRRAFDEAAKFSKRVMVEKHHFGRDYRVTVLRGKPIKVMDRRAGGVSGDGRHTVSQLVEQLNERDKAQRAAMRRQRAPMVLDEEATKLLSARGFTADSVIPEGEFVALRRRANISAGGTYQILPPESLHPDNRMLAVNAAVALGLDIAGVDIISGDPAKSWRETGGIICEVNAQPQIGYRDTEQIYGEILTTLLKDNGAIPVHLIILQNGCSLPAPLPKVAAGANCNAASWGTTGWIAGVGLLGPFANAFRAARGTLLDPRTTGALIVMSEAEVLRFALPAARFASIRLVGEAGWQPPQALRPLIAGHAPRILRQQLGNPAGAAA